MLDFGHTKFERKFKAHKNDKYFAEVLLNDKSFCKKRDK